MQDEELNPFALKNVFYLSSFKLLKRFHAIWPRTSPFSDSLIFKHGIEQWGESLYGISDHILNRVVDQAAIEFDEMPSLWQFKKLCLSIKP